MKLIFKNPCKTCIVKVNCSQICEDKINYGRTLPKISFIVSMLIYSTIIPITHCLIDWVKDLPEYVSVPFLIVYICIACVVYVMAIMVFDSYMDKIKDNNHNERHDIESAILRRKGIPIPPRLRRFR